VSNFDYFKLFCKGILKSSLITVEFVNKERADFLGVCLYNSLEFLRSKSNKVFLNL